LATLLIHSFSHVVVFPPQLVATNLWLCRELSEQALEVCLRLPDTITAIDHPHHIGISPLSGIFPAATPIRGLLRVEYGGIKVEISKHASTDYVLHAVGGKNHIRTDSERCAMPRLRNERRSRAEGLDRQTALTSADLC